MKLVEHESRGCNNYLEVGVYIDYDLGDDNSVTVNGVWLVRPNRDDIDITHMLSASELEQAQQNVIHDLEREAERHQAALEDAAEARMEQMREIAHEEQQRVLNDNQSRYAHRRLI